jgi:hypothetical protein
MCYVEKPVPWERVLVYGFNNSDNTVRLVYNSSFFHQITDVGIQVVSSDYIMLCEHKLLGKWRVVQPVITLYHFCQGKITGRLIIPENETCLRIPRGAIFPFYDVDMDFYVFACPCLHSGKLAYSLTTYICMDRYNVDNKLLEMHLTINQSKIIYEGLSDVKHIFFEFILQDDACLIFCYELRNPMIEIYRRTRQCLTRIQRPPYLLYARCAFMSVNVKLGIYVCYQRPVTSELISIQISNFTSNELTPAECHVIVKQHIEIRGSFITIDRHRHHFNVKVDSHKNIKEIRQGLQTVAYHYSLIK